MGPAEEAGFVKRAKRQVTHPAHCRETRIRAMVNQDEEFAALLSRIKSGSDEALLELVDKYGAHVHRAVHRKLNRAIQSRFDSGDFVQAVWASFFENRDRLYQFLTPQDLVMFLVRVAQNKVTDEVRRRLVLQGRNVNREVSIEQSDVRKTAVSPAPTASEVFMAREQLQAINLEQDDRMRLAARLRQTGASHEKIAEELQIDRKTVQRMLRRLERKVRTT